MTFPYSNHLKPRYEDDLLDDAFVLRENKKHYARQYRGDLERLPRFITKHVVETDLRGELSEIEVYCNSRDERTAVICRTGDWIVVDPSGNAFVLTNDEFTERFISVEDLKY